MHKSTQTTKDPDQTSSTHCFQQTLCILWFLFRPRDLKQTPSTQLGQRILDMHQTHVYSQFGSCDPQILRKYKKIVRYLLSLTQDFGQKKKPIDAWVNQKEPEKHQTPIGVCFGQESWASAVHPLMLKLGQGSKHKPHTPWCVVSAKATRDPDQAQNSHRGFVWPKNPEHTSITHWCFVRQRDPGQHQQPLVCSFGPDGPRIVTNTKHPLMFGSTQGSWTHTKHTLMFRSKNREHAPIFLMLVPAQKT